MRLSISPSEVRDSWRSKLPRCSPDIVPLLLSAAGDPDCSIWNSVAFDVEGSFAPRTVCGAEDLRGREAFSLGVSSCIVPSPNSSHHGTIKSYRELRSARARKQISND